MDDLLREFLTETSESLDRVDAELVRFEQEPNNAEILGNIFRLVHTIKGTCGFLGLPRLETLAHAAETLMGKFRDGMPVTAEAVTLILSTIDRIKAILDGIEAQQQRAGRRRRRSDRAVSDRHAHRRRRRRPVPAASHARRKPPPTPRRSRTKPPDYRRATNRRTSDPTTSAATALANHSIRVNVETLEHLMTTVSELVLTRNQLLEIVRRHEDSDFKVPLQRLSNVTAELQEGVMKTRMQPIGNAWQKLPRIVRDLSAELGKQIELEMHGADTELDRQVLELVKDPLTHLVRNCADHGIETRGRAARRRQAGRRARSGFRPVIRAATSSSRSPTTAAASISRASEPRPSSNGFVSEAEIAAKSGCGNLQFHLRARLLHRRAQVTSISGRGVGMDVVRTNIEQIGGTVDLKSVPGAGTTFTIKIPLTLAIVSALIVEAGGERFAIPQLSVLELVRACEQRRAPHRAHQGHAGAAAAQQAVAAGASQGGAAARRRRRRRAALSWSRRSAARSSASSSTACSTPRKSSSSRCRRSCATSRCSPAPPSSATAR